MRCGGLGCCWGCCYLHHATLLHPWNGATISLWLVIGQFLWWFFHPWKVGRLSCCRFCLYSVALCLCFCNLVFDVAILVKRLLTLFKASAVSLPAGILPLSAVASCWAAAMMWDSGETVGFVMYWCLKWTVTLILVDLVLVMYTRKQQWCSIDVPRLNLASDLASHVRRSSGLTWALIAHPRGAKGFFM